MANEIKKVKVIREAVTQQCEICGQVVKGSSEKNLIHTMRLHMIKHPEPKEQEW